MWDSKTLRLVTRVEMIERPFGHIHIYNIYLIYIYISIVVDEVASASLPT